MERSFRISGTLIACLSLLAAFLASPSVHAETNEFYAEMGPDNQLRLGGPGEWVYYPHGPGGPWWNQWFPNEVYRPATKKITVNVNITGVPGGPDGYVVIAINWSTEEWTGANFPGPNDEDYIRRQILYQGPPPGEAVYEYEIDFCPAWVSIDIQGWWFSLQGFMDHVCIPETGEENEACCLNDGTCIDLPPSACHGRGGVPQGANTNCYPGICPPVPQACCFPDGRCENLLDYICRRQGGIPQGLGSNCDSMDCACGWQPGDPTKMHSPQKPKTGGWDIEFASSILADDWRCSQSGPVEDIHFWVSWMQDRMMPISGFSIAIHEDIPDPDGDGPKYSRPGRILWKSSFHPGDYTIRDMEDDLQSWFDPSSGEWAHNDHVRWQQIDICTIENPFKQEEGTIYWLAIDFGSLPFVGWKQSDSHFNDDGVWRSNQNNQWIELRDPETKESLDLAFVITGGETPSEKLEYGDAPESALAYPDCCVQGHFPTCINLGPSGWIQHMNFGGYLGPRVDFEPDGNAGQCPLFNPDTYNQDECFQDGDAGLIKPPAYTIQGPIGDEKVVPCVAGKKGALGQVCQTAQWGNHIDIEIHNHMPSGTVGYMNVLIDWDRNGSWGGASSCTLAAAPEHVLVNFRVPNPYDGPLSSLNPPSFLIGPVPGYVWARFTFTEKPITLPWDGSGAFEDGETEDYLLSVLPLLKQVNCDWPAGDDSKMHWPQEPDLSSSGVDVDMMWLLGLADDFLCTETGPITDIHFWASFKDDCLPVAGPGAITFELNIYSDRPAGTPGTTHGYSYSMPKDLLWQKRFSPCTYTVRQVHEGPEGWYDPGSGLFQPNNHDYAYQYNFCIPEEEALIQSEGTIYWLYIRPIGFATAAPTFSIGWKTTSPELHWNDDAVFRAVEGWSPLTYPANHPYGGETMDLAFVITGKGTPSTHKLDFGDAPDAAAVPEYPTLLGHNGARHVIVPKIHLGSSIDDELDGQPDPNALGDDNDGNGDEDGVTFTSALNPDNMASVDVVASVKGALNAWLDANRDGDWDDPGEHIFVDEALNSGLNPLTFYVPAGAEPGWTFARFRFSMARGLSYDGLALNGEVEDYELRIEEPVIVIPERLKWSQPPIEWNLPSRTPIYCGWDESAYGINAAAAADVGIWRMAADDFRCLGTMPITSVHWWGSYQNWQEATAPSVTPNRWHIGFWSNVPAGEDAHYSHPKSLLYQLVVPADRVSERNVGIDRFPGRPSDTCFKYALYLKPDEAFRQHKYPTKDNVFWLSVTALYAGDKAPSYTWGWKTRPWHWMDDAVTFRLAQNDMAAGLTLNAGQTKPIKNAVVCIDERSYDLAFALDTDPDYVKWHQHFAGLRRWPHYEDVESMAYASPTATNVASLTPRINRLVADDFKCSAVDPITAAVWWGSYINYRYRACDCPDMAKPIQPNSFILSIWTDVPDPDPTDPTSYSRPGQKVWEYRAKDFDEVLVGFDKHPEGSNLARAREPVFRYSVRLPRDKWFYQATGTNVYWFSVAAVYTDKDSANHRWGWTNHPHSYNDGAAIHVPWIDISGDVTWSWEQVLDQMGKIADMSFVLFTDPDALPLIEAE